MSDKHPLAASVSGKNAYYLGHCRITEHNPAYAACLDKIARSAQGDKNVWPACAEAIRLGTCQAKNMRQAEELAGEALYFIPREQIQTSHNRVPAWVQPPTDSNRVEKDLTPPSSDPYQSEHVKAKPHKNPALDAPHGSFADAINAELTASAAQPATTPGVAPAPPVAPPVTSHVAPIPGESPRQYAQRIAASRKENP